MEEIRSSQKAYLRLSLTSQFLTMFALFETRYNIPPHHLVSLEKQSHEEKHFVTKIEEVNRWVYNPLSHLTSIYLSAGILVFHIPQRPQKELGGIAVIFKLLSSSSSSMYFMRKAQGNELRPCRVDKSLQLLLSFFFPASSTPQD